MWILKFSGIYLVYEGDDLMMDLLVDIDYIELFCNILLNIVFR